MKIYVSTWFYESPIGEKITYPGVGSDSDTWSFQSAYWNCIYCFFASMTSRYGSCPSRYEIKKLLFINKDIPTRARYGDLFDPQSFFDENNVQILNFEPKHLPAGDGPFRSQFAMVDILKRAQSLLSPGDLFIIVDSDCFFINSIPDVSLDDLAERGLQLLKFNWPDSYTNNGVSSLDFNKAANIIAPSINSKIKHFFGGEYYGFTHDALRDFNAVIGDLYQKNFDLEAPLRTEEQLFTLAVEALKNFSVSDASSFIRRVWTDAAKFRSARISDSEMSILHLPAEKRGGFGKFAEQFIIRKLSENLKCSYEEVRLIFNLE